ncbi:MAG: sulfatase [Vicinamibacteria bacterium]
MDQKPRDWTRRFTPFLAVVALFVGCGAAAPLGKTEPAVAAKRPPNLVVVLLDDADVEITEAMPRLRTLFFDKGVRFSSHIANTPLCGPSRAILMSGQYAHNNKVYYNNGPEGGYTPWQKGGYDEHSLGSWLQVLGYRTGLFGKYINDYPTGQAETLVPKGWDDFRGILSDREAHNIHFTMNENGALKLYEASKGGYQTDVLSARMDSFIRAKTAADKPFFAFLSLSAPHVPPEPAERHLKEFAGETAPRKPSYNEADLSDKPKALREQSQPLTKADARQIDVTYREMKQSLLSVEDAMETLIKTLTETGELSRTYIFFTSDNGWFRGEHRIPGEKYAPYEESIRVPMIVRGPGVPEDRVVDNVIGIVDLAPTLLDLAGAPETELSQRDGRSYAPFLAPASKAPIPWRESTLIEHFGGGAPFRVRSYSGVRSENDVYIEYVTGEKEYYDLRKDPYQMDNQAASLKPADASRLSARVAALKDCVAEACRKAENGAAAPPGSKPE